MANRQYVERVRDRLSGVMRMADDMNRGQFDGELETAIQEMRMAASHLDDWLVKDFRRRSSPKPKWIRVSVDCVVRRGAA